MFIIILCLTSLNKEPLRRETTTITYIQQHQVFLVQSLYPIKEIRYIDGAHNYDVWEELSSDQRQAIIKDRWNMVGKPVIKFRIHYLSVIKPYREIVIRRKL